MECGPNDSWIIFHIISLRSSYFLVKTYMAERIKATSQETWGCKRTGSNPIRARNKILISFAFFLLWSIHLRPCRNHVVMQTYRHTQAQAHTHTHTHNIPLFCVGDHIALKGNLDLKLQMLKWRWLVRVKILKGSKRLPNGKSRSFRQF